jgi:hypothetical protein
LTTLRTAEVVALFVERGGVYWNLDGVDPWDEARDARKYAGPWPVVAHPPCQRWGRFYFGGPQWLKDGHPRKQLGDDNGCFASAIAAVRRWGGVLEHPADSRAWRIHGLADPPCGGGWVPAGDFVGWTCCVSQGNYGHRGDKRTWLYAVVPLHDLPELRWGKSDKRVLLAGLSKARRERDRRTGIVQALSKRQRAATPPEFRDVLISIARAANVHANGWRRSIKSSALQQSHAFADHISHDGRDRMSMTLRVREVVALYGFTACHWRKQAAAGLIPGARQTFGARGHWTFDADKLRAFVKATERQRGEPWRASTGAAKSGGGASPAMARNTAQASLQRTEELLRSALGSGSRSSAPAPGATSRAVPTRKLRLVSSANISRP